MRKKIHLIGALFIATLPFTVVRVTLYRLFFRYKIEKSKIGWLTIIYIDNLTMENASINAFNIFSGSFDVVMETNSSIGSFNYFRCGKWAKDMHREGKLVLHKDAFIVSQHYFDLFGTIIIGEKSIIAGVRSQFWTHGGMSTEVNITIGKECYIGSGVKFAPGTAIPDFSLCALGSVVTKKFMKAHTLIGGVPAKEIRSNINWREKWK